MTIVQMDNSSPTEPFIHLKIMVTINVDELAELNI